MTSTMQIEVLFKWNCVAIRGFVILSVEKRRRAIKNNIKYPGKRFLFRLPIQKFGLISVTYFKILSFVVYKHSVSLTPMLIPAILIRSMFPMIAEITITLTDVLWSVFTLSSKCEMWMKMQKSRKRPVLEYCAPVFHHALPQYLSDDIERVQKRALSIICPYASYSECLVRFDLVTFYSKYVYIIFFGLVCT